MEVKSIFSALVRHPLTLTLITLQVAFTFAVACNVLFIVSQRFELMGLSSGMDEQNTFVVTSNTFSAKADMLATVKADLATIRGMPRVVAAAPVVTVPLSGGAWTEDVFLNKDQEHPTTDDVAVYFTDENGIAAYGVALIAGRNFTSNEVGVKDEDSSTWASSVIVSKALSQKLFGIDNAVGKQLFIDRTSPMTVVGIVERLQHADPHHVNDSHDPGITDYSILVPQVPITGNQVTYLVRTTPGARDEVMGKIEGQLTQLDPTRVVEDLFSTEFLRHKVYRQDRAMVFILGVITIAFFSITGLGIAGLANFWVAQRTRQIGTRRAMGATRKDILRYFQIENSIITGLGLFLGTLLTYAINLWLITKFHVSVLPYYYVLISSAVIWLLGQAAVLGPALAAARVPPVVATRSL